MSRAKLWPLPGWTLAALLLVVGALLAGPLGASTRALFVLGCGVVGWYSWRQGPGAHIQAALTLFAFAPFVRRLVDLSVGYDQVGVILIGPLLAILAPVASFLRAPIPSAASTRRLIPLVIVGCCVAYAAIVSMVQGDWMNAASGALKWLAPLLYAGILALSADRDEIIAASTSAFLVILPIIGLYGIFQYIDPPSWDQYWMQFAPIMSAGQPIPYGVRTFSTMNGPASYATFTAVGVLLICFSRAPWPSVVLLAPAVFGLLLSLYRTAWLSLAVGLMFCLLFGATRRRAGSVLFVIAIIALLAATTTPFGDVIADRVATLSEGARDGSAQERLDQFVTLWNLRDSSLFGVGFTVSDVGAAGSMPVDGMIIACWLSMGIVGGLFCLTGLVWAISNAIATAWADRGRAAILIGALSLGALAQLPLANITSGESGFLFWTFAVLLTGRTDLRATG